MSTVSIANNLEQVENEVQAACDRAGRKRSEVTVVAVSKTFPLDDLQACHEAGQVHFGENKPQELGAKAAAWTPRPSGVQWHMIGHLQRNKAGIVAEYADLFHALDSIRLARALDARCQAVGRQLECLVQVNVSGEDSKFGLEPAELPAFLTEVRAMGHLTVTGLMTLAAPAQDPEDVRPQFRLLRALAEEATGAGLAALTNLSMGMSGDFQVAIEEGATHVRVGSAIFGGRSYQQL